MHPNIKYSLIDPHTIFEEDKTIIEDIRKFIFKQDLHKKCLILNCHQYILRVKNYFKIEVINMNNGEIENIVTFPGFVLDLMQNEKGTIIVLGCNTSGNFVVQFVTDQIRGVKNPYTNECFYLDSSSFLHRIHDLGKEKFLAHNLFHYTIQEFS